MGSPLGNWPEPRQKLVWARDQILKMGSPLGNWPEPRQKLLFGALWAPWAHGAHDTAGAQWAPWAHGAHGGGVGRFEFKFEPADP